MTGAEHRMRIRLAEVCPVLSQRSIWVHAILTIGSRLLLRGKFGLVCEIALVADERRTLLLPGCKCRTIDSILFIVDSKFVLHVLIKTFRAVLIQMESLIIGCVCQAFGGILKGPALSLTWNTVLFSILS